MKHLLLTLGAIGLMCIMATSCLENTEPAGITELRTAHAELLRAQASYQTALAAYTDAQTALEMAKVEGENIANELARLGLEEKELEIRMDSIMVAYWEKYYQLEIAKKEADNEYQIAKLEMDLLELEKRRIDVELYMLQQEQEKEQLIIKHQTTLLNLQNLLAKAQAAYDQALRDIAAAKHGLTVQEQDKLDEYIGKIEGNGFELGLKGDLRDAEDVLLAAQRRLVDVKYNLDSVSVDKQLTRQVEAEQEDLENARENLDKVTNLDLSGLESIMAEAEALEAEIKDLEAEIDALNIKAAEKTAEKEEFRLVRDSLNARIDELNRNATSVQDEIDEVYAPFDEEELRSIDIPAELNIVMRTAWYNTQKDMFDIYYNDVKDPAGNLPEGYVYPITYVNRYVWDDATREVIPQDGKLSWSTTKGINYSDFIDSLGMHVQDNILSSVELTELQADYDEWAANAPIKEREYQDSLAAFEEAKAAYDELVAEYGYSNGTYKNSGVLGKGRTAVRTLSGLDVSDPDDETAITAALADIQAEQKMRKELYGNNKIDPDMITFANYEAGSVTYQDIYNAVQTSIVDPYQYTVADKDNISRYYTKATGNEAVSAAERWDNVSMALYGAHFLTEPLTLEALGYGEMWYDIARIGQDTWWIVYTSEYNEKYLNEHIAAKYGFTDILTMINSDYLFYNAFRSPVYADYLKAVIDGQDGLKTIMSTLKTMRSELETLSNGIYAEEVALKEELLALNQETSKTNELIKEVKAEIDRIDVEIKAINDETLNYSEVSVVNRQIRYKNNVLEVLKGILDGENFTFTDIAGQEYTYDATLSVTENAEALAKLQETWIENNTEELQEAEDALALAQQNLERFRKAEDWNAWAIENAELAVQRAQEDYDALLELFNYYNGLLQDFLTSILGVNNGTRS